MKPVVALVSFALGFGAFLAWRRGRAASALPALPAAQRTAVATTSSPAAPAIKISSAPKKVPTIDDSPSANQSLYLQHLANAATNVATIQAGAETHEESEDVNQAWAALSVPLDVLTAQKDLNVLGAKPPLTEDGVLGPKTRDAIDSFQRAMQIPPNGVMDAQTSNALRRAVVAATSSEGDLS